MKERGMLFSKPMVLALLDGSKTQTRRIVKPQPTIDAQGNFCWNGWNFGQTFEGPRIQAIASPLPGSITKKVHCPYGKPGDWIWVRETARLIGKRDDGKVLVRYEVDGELATVDWPDRLKPLEVGKCVPNGCHREAARTYLEITSVRVERLQSISESDAIAEGITSDTVIVGANCNGGRHSEEHAEHFFYDGCDEAGFESAVDAYRALWESINGAGSWDANPWCWVVDFRRVKP